MFRRRRSDRKRRNRAKLDPSPNSQMIERSDATPLALDLDRAILAACSAGMVLESTSPRDTPEADRERILDALADGSLRWAQQSEDHTRVVISDASNIYYWMQECVFGVVVDGGSDMP